MKPIDLVVKTYKFYKNVVSFSRRYVFEKRSNDCENLCVILAGYKEYTWDIIFDRINEFSNDNIDICILSSGLYSEKLSKIAKKYNWSYLSTKRNNVALIQNTAIKLFPNAKFIYKLDEDIFITKNFFDTMQETYEKVEKEGDYRVGFVAPIIPINGYSYVVLLNKLGLYDYYEEHFEKPRYYYGTDAMIVNSPEVAKFMWGCNNKVPQIDDLDKQLHDLEFSYSASPIRFNIGAIYFPRELWEQMHYFKVDWTSGMGKDEHQISSHCIRWSRAIIIAENTCVGHLSFSQQNNEMENYFNEHPEKFQMNI